MPIPGLMQMSMNAHATLSGFFLDTTQLLDDSTPKLGTACAYVAASAAAGIAWRTLGTTSEHAVTRGGILRQRFWAAATILLALAAMDRTVGLLAYGAEIGRSIFGALDLYQDRGTWQVAAMVAVLLAAIIAIVAAWHRTRRIAVSGRLQKRDAATALVLMGMIALVVCRAISWHDLEAVLVASVGAFKLGTIIEWTFIAGMVACAATTIRWSLGNQRRTSTSVLLASS